MRQPDPRARQPQRVAQDAEPLAALQTAPAPALRLDGGLEAGSTAVSSVWSLIAPPSCSFGVTRIVAMSASRLSTT